MSNALQILAQRNAARANGTTPAPLTKTQKGGAATAALGIILAGIFVVEGGYVNDPKDRGGPTNYGVTEAVARENGYEGDMRNFPKKCYGAMTVCAEKIYTDRYVRDPGFYPLLTIEPAVAQELIDTGVNMGPRWPSIWFQASLNVLCGSKLTTDGKVGPATVKAYTTCAKAQGAVNLCVKMLNSLDATQEKRYRSIVARNPSQNRFLKGWLRHRINNVDRKMCGNGEIA